MTEDHLSYLVHVFSLFSYADNTEIKQLIQVLHDKFDLKCSLQSRNIYFYKYHS